VVKKPGLDLRALTEVYDHLVSEQSDIVLMHSITAAPSGWLWKRSSNKPFIIVDHTAPAARSATVGVSVALSLVVADAFVALTPANRAALIKRAGFLRHLAARAIVIPNGISTRRFSPAKPPRARSGFTISMTARFCAARDHIGLVEGISALLMLEPSLRDSLRVVLAGDGETRLQVEHAIKRLDLADVIELPGFISESQVVALMRETDVYVQWSYADSMSTSVMQAMACGVAVVATNTHGMSFLVEDGQTGYLLDVGDSPALAETLLELWENGDRRRSLGQAGRRHLVSKWSSETMAKRYSELFNQLHRAALE
jgi:glycosyltransferase involved in cell wall biosynthesis